MIIESLLSKKGKEIFFPNRGILAQSFEANGMNINATIGMGLENEGKAICLKSIKKNIKLPIEDIFPYASSYGLQGLREIWLKKIKENNPSLRENITTPIVTNGITHGLNIIGYLFVNEGDKIIIPELFWGNYNLIFEKGCNAELDKFPMFFGEGFNVGGLKEKLNSTGKKKIVLLNFPNNPTGYSLTNEDVDKVVLELKEAAKKGKEILVVCDDAYFGLFYEESVCKESLFGKLVGLHSNLLAVKIDGATKEDYAWGLRVGFITYGVADKIKILENKTAGVIRGTISNVSRLSQNLLLKAYEDKNYLREKNEKYELLKSRYEKVKETLLDEKYKEVFLALPFNSGYFMCLKLNKELDAELIRIKLLEKYSTGVIATRNFLRIAFSSVPTDKIPSLFENIYNSCLTTIKG